MKADPTFIFSIEFNYIILFSPSMFIEQLIHPQKVNQIRAERKAFKSHTAKPGKYPLFAFRDILAGFRSVPGD